MQRRETIVANGAANATFGANFLPCPVGTKWLVTRIAIRLPNWVSGQVIARVLLDGQQVAASMQGNEDTADGDGLTVSPSQALRVEWTTTPNVVFTGTLQGVATADIEQSGG